MSDPILTLVFSLAATLPAAGIGWAAGRIADGLTRAPGLRHTLWSSIAGLSVLSAAAVPAWTFQARVAPTAFRAVKAHRFALQAHAAPLTQVAHPLASLIQPTASGLLAVVAAGAAIGLCLWTVRLARLNQIVRRAATAGPALQRAVIERAAALALHPPEVRLSDEASAAMLVGLRQPAIILPTALADRLSLEALAMICAHELAHLKRGDHWRAPLERFLGCLLWFNPFFMDALARRAAAGEALCDAVALSGADAAERRRYAATLVEALRQSGVQTLHPAFIRRKGPDLAMRLKAILHPPAKPGLVVFLATAGIASASAVSMMAVSSAVARQVDNAAMRAQGAASPAQIRPDVTFQVIFKKGDTLLGSPTVLGQFGRDVQIESPGAMRVIAMAEKPGQDGRSFTSAKMSVFQNNAWQAPKVMTMRATLSATPSFEYSVEGTPYRFVVMPRLIVPSGETSAATATKFDARQDLLHHPSAGLTVDSNQWFRNRDGSTVASGSPHVRYWAAAPNLTVAINGTPASPEKVNDLSPNAIQKIVTTNEYTPGPFVPGRRGSNIHIFANIITKWH